MTKCTGTITGEHCRSCSEEGEPCCLCSVPTPTPTIFDTRPRQEVDTDEKRMKLEDNVEVDLGPDVDIKWTDNDTIKEIERTAEILNKFGDQATQRIQDAQDMLVKAGVGIEIMLKKNELDFEIGFALCEGKWCIVIGKPFPFAVALRQSRDLRIQVASRIDTLLGAIAKQLQRDLVNASASMRVETDEEE